MCWELLDLLDLLDLPDLIDQQWQLDHLMLHSRVVQMTGWRCRLTRTMATRSCWGSLRQHWNPPAGEPGKITSVPQSYRSNAPQLSFPRIFLKRLQAAGDDEGRL